MNVINSLALHLPNLRNFKHIGIGGHVLQMSIHVLSPQSDIKGMEPLLDSLVVILMEGNCKLSEIARPQDGWIGRRFEGEDISRVTVDWFLACSGVDEGDH